MYREKKLSPATLELFTELQSIIESTLKLETPEFAGKTPLVEIDLSVHEEDREYYDLHQAQLMSDFGFRASCLMELLPIFQTCLKEVGTQRTLPVDNNSEAPGDLPDPTLRKVLTKALPKATSTIRNRLFRLMRQHHNLELLWICSFDDCTESTRMLTKQEWVDHEMRRHRSKTVWACHMCQSEHVTFEEWNQHLYMIHRIPLKEHEALLYGRLSCKVVLEPLEYQVCNFCREQPLGFRSSWEAFFEHVSSHMKICAEETARLFTTNAQQPAEEDPPVTAASSKQTPFPEQQSKRGTATMGEERQIGQVKWFDDEKGIGFITPESGNDLFVRFRALQATRSKSLNAEQWVSFVIVEGQKGKQADDVRILD